MSRNSYRLINPSIEGNFNSVIKAKNSFSAGKKIYKELSKYFTNHVEDFGITIQNIETAELSHFLINEERKGAKNINYDIINTENNFPEELENTLVKKINDSESIKGGKKNRNDSDSSESSTSSSNSYNYMPNIPITRFSYFYLPYYKLFNNTNILVTNRFLLPTFSWPITPLVEVRMDLYKLF